VNAFSTSSNHRSDTSSSSSIIPTNSPEVAAIPAFSARDLPQRRS
jgi:hypothetical protein